MSNQIFSDVKEASSKFYCDALAAAQELDGQIYLMCAPWVDNQYNYDYRGGWTFLKPGYPITFVQEDDNSDAFEDYMSDFKEDLGHIVDKYGYSEKLGRPRTWESLFFKRVGNDTDFRDYLSNNELQSKEEKRKVEILISLLIGSINKAEEISLDPPETLLEKVKNKILLFDSDQTKFLYQEPAPEERIIWIQGLAGTGKTELLLHKIKDIFVKEPDSIIGMTCHNKVLAGVLWNRLIQFFNSKGVNRQIDPEKLRCFHAWGSYSDPDSGMLRYICSVYELPFYSLRETGNFDNACLATLKNLKKSTKYKEGVRAFDYIFIDENQDFPDSFFELCDLVTSTRIYAAGDIFQNIFTISRKNPGQAANILLNRCYRTDPRTFMFAHGMGMGLFERNKINWLSDEDWEKCGYEIEKLDNDRKYRLSRKPVRRFEDIPADYKSISIFVCKKLLFPIIKKIDEWKEAYPNLKPDDIAIILLDNGKDSYSLASGISDAISRRYEWNCNLAYITKRKVNDTLFISNRNNVKGLEFPFVICVTDKVMNNLIYRHTLYTMLSRSHLQSVLVVSEMDKGLKNDIIEATNEIMSEGYVTVNVPDEDEQRHINEVKLHTNNLKLSLEERVAKICKEKQIPESNLPLMLPIIEKIKGDLTDELLETKINQLWGIYNNS